MSLPPRTARVVVAMGALTFVLAAVAHGDQSHDPAHALAALAILGGVIGFSTRSALVLLQGRSGALQVDANAGRTHRLLPRTLPAAALAAACGAALAAAPQASRALGLFVLLAGLMGVVLGIAFTRLDRGGARRPRQCSRLAFIALDTAVPSAVVAAAVGVVVGLTRLSALSVVHAEVTARHLAGSVFLYAVFVGLGGFLKTYSEQSAGLVIVDKTTAAVPGPILTGGVLGVLLLVVGPWVLPDLGVQSVLALKGACGFVVGGALSALGAIQGARAASLGLKRRRRG